MQSQIRSQPYRSMARRRRRLHADCKVNDTFSLLVRHAPISNKFSVEARSARAERAERRRPTLFAGHVREDVGAFGFGFRPGFIVGEAFGFLFGDVGGEGGASRRFRIVGVFVVAEFAGLAGGVERGRLVGEFSFGGGEVGLEFGLPVGALGEGDSAGSNRIRQN